MDSCVDYSYYYLCDKGTEVVVFRVLAVEPAHED
jgi:hypothetical protein